MKTGALHTTKTSKKERSEKIAAGQALVGFFMEYLNVWTTEQANELIKQNPSLCIPYGPNGYIIGTYKITGTPNRVWEVCTAYGDRMHDFHDKAAAVFYCYYLSRNVFTRAQELLTIDSEIFKLSNDIGYYQHGYKQALKRQDWFKVDLFTTRTEQAKVQLAQAQERLQKTLWAAKYNKVWDRKP